MRLTWLCRNTTDQTISDDEVRFERVRRKQGRYPFWRLIFATVLDFGALVRDSWVALLGFSIISALTTSYLLLSGIKDSLTLALFETLRMLVLQSSLDPPLNDPIGVVIVFMTPLLGLALIFQSVLNFGRLLLDKSSRLEAWQVSLAATFRDHVIVCGLGRVGYRVVLQLLDAGYEVVVIEKDWSAKFVPIVLRLKTPIIMGDARDIDILLQAGITHARGLITVINDDLLNIEIALSARRNKPTIQVVLRIFHQELDRNLERSFGRNMAFSSSALAAPTLAAAALTRNIVHVLPLVDGFVGLIELTIEADSELSGLIHKIEERFDVRVVRHRNAHGREYPARLSAQLADGDVVTLLGDLNALERAQRSNQPSVKLHFLRQSTSLEETPHYNTVIISGLGKVGYRVVKELTRYANPRPHIVVICGQDTHQQFIEDVQRMDVRVIMGDAREADVLRDAGLERAYSVVAVTSDNLINLQIGLIARQIRDDIHLVLRVFSDVLAERLATLFHIRTAFSSSALAAPTLAAAVMTPGIDHAIDIGTQLLSTVTLVVRAGDEFANQTLYDVRKYTDALVVALRRNGVRIIPLKLDTWLQVDDQIVVLVNIDVLSKLRARGAQSVISYQ